VLFPTRFLVARLPFGRVGLFPLGNGLRFTAAHFVIHTSAVFLNNRNIDLRILVVLQTLSDPFNVIGIGAGASRPKPET
jgi:hypothetical protein